MKIKNLIIIIIIYLNKISRNIITLYNIIILKYIITLILHTQQQRGTHHGVSGIASDLTSRP